MLLPIVRLIQIRRGQKAVVGQLPEELLLTQTQRVYSIRVALQR